MRSAAFIICAMASVVASPLLALVTQEKPRNGEIAFVVAPPFGASIENILEASQMQNAFPDRAPLGAFVILGTSRSYDLLIENGAWFVVQGKGILDLC